MNNKQVKDDSSAEQTDDTPAESPSKRPLWSRDFNRVTASIWKSDRGDARHSTAIFRSYYDKKEGKWKRAHYYDREDLLDVKLAADEALKQIDSLNSGGQSA